MSLQSIKDIKMDIILVVESVAISTIGVTIGQLVKKTGRIRET